MRDRKGQGRRGRRPVRLLSPWVPVSPRASSIIPHGRADSFPPARDLSRQALWARGRRVSIIMFACLSSTLEGILSVTSFYFDFAFSVFSRYEISFSLRMVSKNATADTKPNRGTEDRGK